MNTALPTAQEQERPPHVEFELVPVEDRAASMKAGRKIMVDKEFANIYPRGGKDMVIKEVPTKKEGEYPSPQYQEFMGRFGPQYEAWKSGLDIPVEGTDLRQFPLLTPAQIENCRTFHIYTVEQLAETNEETLQNLGMGSRNLKMTAQRWLEFGENGGKQVSRIEELEVKNQALSEKTESLTTQVAELRAELGKSDVSPVPVATTQTAKKGGRGKRGK